MQVKELRLAGLKLVEPRVFIDARGLFFESYRRSRYKECGIEVEFVQDNTAVSCKGAIRGLHYQLDPGQAKLVSVSRGAIWDVAVDIRPNSPTFGEWEAAELSEENHRQFFIPVGFAHGYCVLSDTARVHYKASADYDPLRERSILWDDPDLNIPWPTKSPILSDRDRTSPRFASLGKS